jgi:hypothetical protein
VGGKERAMTSGNEEEELPELDVLWKIVSPLELETWRASGTFTLESNLDKTDGFFHCSNSHRIEKTAELYFKTVSDHKMVKIETKRLTRGNSRSVVFCADAPSEEEIKNSGDVIFIHYLLVEGKACCAHLYANFEKHPLETEDCVAEVFDMPWDEANGKHAFPGLK